MHGGWEEGKLKSAGSCFLSPALPLPYFSFTDWCLLTGTSAEERDLGLKWPGTQVVHHPVPATSPSCLRVHIKD